MHLLITIFDSILRYRDRSRSRTRGRSRNHFYLIADVTLRLPREKPSFVAPEDLFYGCEEVGGMMVGAFDEDAKTIDPATLPEPFALTLFPPAWDKVDPYFQKAAIVFPALESAPIRHFVNGAEVFHA